MNSNSNLEPASKELERVSCQVREHFAEKTWTGVGTQCQFFRQIKSAIGNAMYVQGP